MFCVDRSSHSGFRPSVQFYVLISVASLFLLGVVASAVFAQSPEEVAKKYGIAFPIAELGNCSSVSQCRTFCEDPVNQSTCMEFAKKKGLYKEEAREDVGEGKEKILEKEN